MNGKASAHDIPMAMILDISLMPLVNNWYFKSGEVSISTIFDTLTIAAPHQVLIFFFSLFLQFPQ